MKLITYTHQRKESTGILTDKYIYPLPFPSMNALIEGGISFERISAMAGNPIAISETDILSPIPQPKQDIICLGVNFMAHAEESAKFKKEEFNGERPYAVYFSKRVNESLPHNGTIRNFSKLTSSLDYECELGVIIGRTCKNVKKENAFKYIFGYTIINDISARDIQTRHKQWYFGKSLDGFAPMGPAIVTEDEFERPPVLALRSYVNGELRQDSSTDLFIFDIPHVISELSAGMTLKAGTIISMGTPAGVGMGFEPPRFLKYGDVVECFIENIGTLRTYIG